MHIEQINLCALKVNTLGHAHLFILEHIICYR